ncbi:Fimbrial protein precursor [compost metagenome]|jgi:type IV pilus assembly protein PilE|uniref:type IV pilin protein n=1 Tax=Aeromonas TaxID=642 RepID=UPI000F912216|nr:MULTISPECIES: type IV pilin protein [Aeromonas]MBS4701337.1 type IV pilin protein [Aeromonas media]MDM5093965.1 type IV pilin protein [Aeromonas rivipollensis]QIY88770.1 prepilin-type N-terminal cleavage/methylation domain-containing protein [Aeromonas hydrophila]
MRTKQSGITLLELLVVVAVVAILAAVAYPSFTNGLQKSRRAEALKGLLSMQLKQEEFRISNASYSGTPSQVGNPASDYYTFTISGATATVYTLIATAKGSQSNDAGCTILTLNKADTKTPSDCWK